MSNLLALHWYIARRQVPFLLLLLFFFLGSIVNTLENGPDFSLTGGIGLALAALAAFFIGEQGSSGRLDSEIISGFSRTQIWLSNFLLLLFLGLLLLAAAIIGEFAAVALKYDFSPYSVSGFGLFLGGAILNTGAYAAVCTLITLCLAGRSSGRGVVALIVLVCIFLVFFIWGSALSDMLSEPEYYTYYGYANGDVIAYGTSASLDMDALEAYARETGQDHPEEPQFCREYNPQYIDEPLRTQYTQILQFIPLTQIYMLSELAFSEPENAPELFDAASTLWLNAVIIIAGCTAAGILLFKRRNLD